MFASLVSYDAQHKFPQTLHSPFSIKFVIFPVSRWIFFESEFSSFGQNLPLVELNEWKKISERMKSILVKVDWYPKKRVRAIRRATKNNQYDSQDYKYWQ